MATGAARSTVASATNAAAVMSSHRHRADKARGSSGRPASSPTRTWPNTAPNAAKPARRKRNANVQYPRRFYSSRLGAAGHCATASKAPVTRARFAAGAPTECRDAASSMPSAFRASRSTL